MLYRFTKNFIQHRVRISETEKIALLAGIDSKPKETLENNILRGKSIQPIIQKFEYPTLSTEAKNVIDNYVLPLQDSVNNYQISKQGGLTDKQFDLCRPLFGLSVPPKWGGFGLGIHDQSQIVQYINSRSVVAGVTVMVPNSLGPAELISHYGTDEQKDTYLSKLATGNLTPCFGLTGVFSGSDAANMLDRGEVIQDEQGNLKIVIDCEKRYITLAPKADIVGLAFKLEDPYHYLDSIPEAKTGITLAILERDTPNLKIGERHDPMGIGMCNGTIVGDKVEIDISQVIGGISGTGEGWKMLMECLTIGRGVSLPAASVSSLKTAATYTGSYARVRTQFRRPLAELQGVQEHLARLLYHTTTSIASQSLFNAIADQDTHLISPTLSAILKFSTTERARKGVNHSLDVLGGMGICEGEDNFMAGIYHGIPIPITVEGSNTLTRSLIVYGQGLLRGKDDLRGIWESVSQDNPKQFYQCLQSVVVSSIVDVTKGIGYRLLPDRFLSMITSNSSGYQDYLQASFASLLTITTPILPLLKQQQVFSGAMADIFAGIYEIEAIRWIAEKNPDAIPDRLVEYCITQILIESFQSMAIAKKAISDINPMLGILVSSLVYVPNTHHLQSSPSQIENLSHLITKPGATRDWISENIDLEIPRLKQTEEIFQKIISKDTSVTPEQIKNVLMVNSFD